jgi:colicin import membrane protein
MRKISKSLLTVALMSTMFAGVSYAAGAGVTAADVIEAKEKAEALALALAEKNKAASQKVDSMKSAALDKAAQLELQKKERAEERARKAEAFRLAEEKRIKEEEEEEARLAAEEEEKQKQIQLEIEAETKKAVEKAKKRAENVQLHTNLVAAKQEIVDLATALSGKEKELGEANGEIVRLKSEIDDMKAKEAEIAKTIISSNRATNQTLQKQIAGNVGTDVKTAQVLEKGLAGLKKRASSKKLVTAAGDEAGE